MRAKPRRGARPEGSAPEKPVREEPVAKKPDPEKISPEDERLLTSSQALPRNEALLRDFDAQVRRGVALRAVLKNALLGGLIILAAVYFGTVLFGPFSLDTLLSLEATKRDLAARIQELREQNAKAQKDFFELKGLYPNEK